MSVLLKTKPSWAPNAIPTDRGWVNPTNNEVLVAIGNLRTLLGDAYQDPEQPKKRGRVKKEKVIAETVSEQPKDGAQIIAEVIDAQKVAEPIVAAGTASDDTQIITE